MRSDGETTMTDDGWDGLEPDHEPDVERPCPNCGGTVAVYLGEVGESGEEQCTIQAVIHLEPTE